MPKYQNKRLLSIDDLYEFFSTHKNSMNFNAEKSGYNIAVSTKGIFEVEEDDNAEGLLYCKVRAFHDLDNVNKSYIDTDVLQEKMMSMKDRPIMADIVETNEKDSDGNPIKDFAGHSMTWDEEKEKFVYIEKPVGHFVNPEGFVLSYDEEYERNFVFADCVIYEEYTDACDILRRRETVDCSVELIIRDMAYNAKTKVLVFNDFYVQGVTLLGENVKPGMRGSKVTLKDFAEVNNSVFSSMEDDTNAKIIEMLEKLNNTLASFNINQKQVNDNTNLDNNGKEGRELSKFEELLSKYGKTAEDITFDYSELSDEELEAKFAEMFADDNKDDDPDDGKENGDNPDDDPDEGSDGKLVTNEKFTKTFELSHEDIRSALYVLLEPYEEADNTFYWIMDVYDDYFVYESWEGKIFGQKYSKDNETDTVTFADERWELFAELLTASEKAELDTMRSNYSAIESELATYKANELDAQKEAVFADETYAEYLDTESFKAIRKDIANYSVEDLRTQCELAFAKEVRKANKTAAPATFAVKDKPEVKTTTLFAMAGQTHDSSFLDGLLQMKP